MTTTPAARDERQLFEAAYLKDYFYPAQSWSLVPEKYRTQHADIAWRAWQARSALAESELAEAREQLLNAAQIGIERNQECKELRAELERVRKRVVPDDFIEFLKRAPVSSGVCVCGETMGIHSSGDHVPVDMWDASLAQYLAAMGAVEGEAK